MEAGDDLPGLQADRLAIADLVHGYARNVRDGRGADCAAMFREDAVFEMWVAPRPGVAPELRRRLEGRDAIVAHVAASSRADARVCPMIHNLIVTIDGNVAAGDCTMTAVTLPGGDDLVGMYQDSFHKDGDWRFTMRRHTILLHRSPTSGGGLPAEPGA